MWHRWNGKSALYLIVAHVVFVTVGFSLNDRISEGPEVQALLTTTYPGMGTATIGTVLFIVVACSSYAIARRRLRYEVWYCIHFTAYASIALLVVFRVLVPLARTLAHGMRVSEVVQKAPGSSRSRLPVAGSPGSAPRRAGVPHRSLHVECFAL